MQICMLHFFAILFEYKLVPGRKILLKISKDTFKVNEPSGLEFLILNIKFISF